MIKMVVFDMAGTVVDENNVVYKTLQAAINDADIDVDLEQVLDEGAGKEKSKAVRDIVNRFAPDHDEDAIGDIYQNFLVLLAKAYENLAVFPIFGAEELFRTLKERDILVVLNTGYNRKTAEQLLKKLGWTKGLTFDELVTASDVASTRPYPDMILHAMKLRQLDNPSDVIKVGDSAIDIEEGKNANCGVTVGITTGAHTRKQLQVAHPDYIIDRLPDLLDLPELKWVHDHLV